MNNDKWMFAVGGLVVGLLLSGIFASYAVNNNDSGMMRMMGMRYQSNSWGMHGAMEDMMSGLQNQTGDNFDRAFLTEMIEHHQGAVSMATAALSSAQHQEIKDLAKAIIDSQSKEIQQMREWQQVWYK